ncbi:MAG: S-layer homology domain-containing protein [Peptococcaceae bacterium]|nr:S-layer homology domain-containing protein [Peptococcaceae bacterium]
MKKLLMYAVLAVFLVLGTAGPGPAAQPPGNWSAVGEVSDPYAECLLSVNGVLYAGAVDGNVRSWNGTQWVNVGGLAGYTVSNSVQGLAAANGTVYAGTANKGVWAWNGSAWSRVGSLAGNAARVSTLATVNEAVYAGTWDGVWTLNGTDWSPVGSLGKSALSLATVNGAVYAGTDDGVWAWNGSAWSRVGSLAGNAARVTALAAVNGAVYAGTWDGVWAWNGSTWSRIGNLQVDTVLSLVADNEAIHAGTDKGVWAWHHNNPGWFQVESGWIPGDPANVYRLMTNEAVVYSLIKVNGYLHAATQVGVGACWDGSSWYRLGSKGLPGLAADVICLATDNRAVYAGTWGGGVWTWDGSAWSPVGGLTKATEHSFALITVNGKLYAGTWEGVWSWDGSAWSGVGNLSGDSAKINSLTSVSGMVYAGTWDCVWALNGSAWSRVGSLTDGAKSVNSLAAVGGTVYAGTDDGVWIWDGSAWSPVGSLPGDAALVKGLAVINSTIYAGTLGGVWNWNGTDWSLVGSLTGDAAEVRSLVAVNGTLYAGTADGVWAWNGFAWSRVGSLPDAAALVSSLAAVSDKLYAGTADGVWSFNLTGSSDGSGGGSKASRTVHNTTGSAVVHPSAGGTVGLGGEASVTIPPGALQGNTGIKVTVRKVASPPPAPGGYTIVGAYEFTVNDLDHYTFNIPVTLTFAFDPSMVPEGTTPAVYYHNGSEWVLLTGTVDRNSNTITVTLDHFTVYAVMAKAPAQAPDLKDIAGHWAQGGIEKLVSLGAVTGYRNGTFRPDNRITRAEFTVVLVKAFKIAPGPGRVFADTTGHWAGDFISAAAGSGIVQGYGDGRFGPDDPVTREQMAAMIVKAANLSPAPGDPAFADSGDISAWASVPVVTAVKNGIIKGYEDGTFRPGAYATRAEAVMMIVNALDK